MDNFIESARLYCDHLAADQHDVGVIRQMLLTLMQEVTNLEAREDDENVGRDFTDGGRDALNIDVKTLADLPLQYYRTVLDPFDFDDDSFIVGDVTDDLADIYNELLHGLQAHDAGDTIYAVNHWRNSYHTHWSWHAIGALTAIESFLRGQRDQ